MQVYYARSNRHEFICFCEYLLWVKANDVNYLVVSLQGVQRSERRLNICKPNKGREASCMQGFIYNLTTVLKTAVDKAILEICHFFASPLIR